MYLLRNLGLNSFVIPIKSCRTRTWPSTLPPAPIPIIGMLISFATLSANLLGTFSKTIAKQPIFSNKLASSVIRAVERALVVVDLPFGTYQSDSQAALESAIRIMKESGSHAVKLEGGKEIKDSIKRILKAGIPVMGHLGLTPQSIYKFGTYTVRAKEDKEANQLIEDAHLLEKIGCFAIVLEKVPSKLAERVAKEVNIPIIGIGAGGNVDGQVLVLHDLIGMTKEFNPRFLRRYMNLHDEIVNAISNFSDDIKSGDFPNENEQY